MNEVVHQEKPIKEANIWNEHQTNEPILIAAKQDEIFAIEEVYEDLISEGWLNESSIKWVNTSYKFKNGKWRYYGRESTLNINIELLTFLFTNAGYTVNERKALTEKEVVATFENENAKVTIDAAIYNDMDECYDFACYIKESVLKTSYCFSIPEAKIEGLLSDMKIITFNSDQQFCVGSSRFDNINDLLKEYPLTDLEKQDLIFRHHQKNLDMKLIETLQGNVMTKVKARFTKQHDILFEIDTTNDGYYHFRLNRAAFLKELEICEFIGSFDEKDVEHRPSKHRMQNRYNGVDEDKYFAAVRVIKANLKHGRIILEKRLKRAKKISNVKELVTTKDTKKTA